MMEPLAAEHLLSEASGDDETGAALSQVALLQFRVPEGFADRVSAAVGQRRVAAILGAAGGPEWARRGWPPRRRALSSALIAGAVVLGLQARHRRRQREVKAA